MFLVLKQEPVRTARLFIELVIVLCILRHGKRDPLSHRSYLYFGLNMDVFSFKKVRFKSGHQMEILQ